MLGHHQQVTAQAEEPSIVDEDAKRVQALEVELRVKELGDSSTGTITVCLFIYLYRRLFRSYFQTRGVLICRGVSKVGTCQSYPQSV